MTEEETKYHVAVMLGSSWIMGEIPVAIETFAERDTLEIALENPARVTELLQQGREPGQVGLKGVSIQPVVFSDPLLETVTIERPTAWIRPCDAWVNAYGNYWQEIRAQASGIVLPSTSQVAGLNKKRGGGGSFIQ